MNTAGLVAAVMLLSLCRVSPGWAATMQPFRVTAQPITTGKRLEVRLSVTNVSPQSQVFWVASGYCTNERWKTDDPNIQIIDYCVSHLKMCMAACEHKVTLRSGETFVRVVSPYLSRRTRLGRRMLRFVNFQPNLALTDGSRLSPTRKYPPRAFWSPPVALTIRKEWLTM